MTQWRVLLISGLLFTGAAACGDDGDGASADATTSVVADSPAPAPTEAATTDPATTEPATTVGAEGEWETITAPSDCMCGDGAEFRFFVRHADPTKVVFFLEGGGACFSAETCGPDSDTYKREVGEPIATTNPQGIFKFSAPENPFADWSVVFVPYCTGDVHIGNKTMDYGDGVVVEHKGYVNATTALEQMAATFPDATELVVAGESAGSVPTPLYAGMASDLLPAAHITVMADGSGAYPDIPAINGVIGAAWGTMNAVPDWPENEGLTVEDWSFPGLYVQAAAHAPDIFFARHDYAYDKTQVQFALLAGIPGEDLMDLIDQNEVQIEASGVDLFSFITPGDRHTVLHKANFYSEEVNGVMLVDWVVALLSGEPLGDVHCTECR